MATSEQRQLSEIKRALLAKRIASAAAGGKAYPQIPRRAEPGPAPLSFAQERLWFLDRLHPGNTAYVIPAALRMRGRLQTAALAASLNGIIARHGALRTTFATAGDLPVQRIAPSLFLALPQVDLLGLKAEVRESEIQRWIASEVCRPFDLEQGPLVRWTLLRLAPEEHVLFLILHHIVADGWSMEIFQQELAAFYTALAHGRPAFLPALPIQYGDFALWQRRSLTGEVLGKELAYWRKQLAGAPPLLDLPMDRPRPAAPSLRGGGRIFRLEEELAAKLRALGRQEGGTLFMTLLAVFEVLLHRITDRTDLVIGTPVANRNRPEIEPLIGFFVNTLVLRTDLGNDPSWRGLAGRVRDVALEAYAHQDLPFELLVEALRPERSLSISPVFQVLFALQNAPAASTGLPGLRLELLEVGLRASRLDLTLAMTEEERSLRGYLEYSSDLFDPSTIDRLLSWFERLLQAVVADPARRISALSLSTGAELAQVLLEWNDTGGEPEWEGPVQRLVERRARERPRALSAVDASGELTYGELEERAGSLAHHLRALGVGPDVPVGVCVRRSREMLVCFLGVLKAGGAFLPLDPSSPPERLAYMLAESAAPVVLAQEGLLDRLPPTAARIVRIDGDGERLGPRLAAPPVPVDPDHLAYILYTSGSTGRPKGVQISHRALMNLVRWDSRAYGTGPEDRRTQLASLSFDASVWEIWPTLAAGACLCVPAEDVRLDPMRLQAWMAEREVTISFLPTPLAEALMIAGGPRVPSLRWLLVGGDRLQRHPSAPSSFRLINHYGPTEAAVVTSAALVPARPAEWSGAQPPIGRPIDGLRICLLDRGFQPVPVGVPGELYAGGPSLARGYLRQPAMTAERFVPDPFAGRVGERLYRTGDLCRFRPDGNVEFLGRIDQQVKLRGLRIELGEIEAALAAHPAVRETAVALRSTPAGGRLVAWVVPRSGPAGEPLVSELRRHLSERLPEYMVPSVIALLESLPLSPSGKVDRRALPEPEDRPPRDQAETAPRDPVEELLCAMMAELLGVERLGPRDDFFALGGHSLLAARVVSRVGQALGIDLPVRSLFDHPTAAALARSIRTARYAESGLPLLAPIDRRGELPLSFAQERLWVLHRLEPNSSAYNVPMALHLRGDLKVEVLWLGLQEVMRRHQVLRTTFVVSDGRPRQRIAPPRAAALPVLDLSALPTRLWSRAVDRLRAEEARRPFGLDDGELPLRSGLLRLGPREWILLLTVHHVAADGWSVSILTDELGRCYRAFDEGRPPDLEPLPVQYVDFAVWQRNWLRGETLERQLAHWRGRLAGAPETLDLSTDRPRPAIRSFAGAAEMLRLPPALSQRAKAVARQEDVTPFMLLLAVFAALLQRYTGKKDLLIGVPVAGRSRPELEKLIGLFLDTLVLRQDFAGEPPFQIVLRRVRDTVLDAFAHQDLPFEKLVEELRPERDLGRSPLFQVAFNLLNAPRSALDLPGVAADALPALGVEAKLDLSVHAEEGPEGFGLAWVYSTDLFDAPTIRRAARHFAGLLESVLEAPARRVADLSLLTEAEMHQLRLEWNDTRAACHVGSTLPERFLLQAVRSPEAVALHLGEERRTYGELVFRVRALAERLRHRGVAAETMTALCFERSFEMVEAVLAVLVAGGAYVALDPRSPQPVLASLLETVNPGLLLTQERLLPRIPCQPGLETFALDRSWPGPPGEDGLASRAPMDPGSLAYVSFTSGTTGAPKGILGIHRGVANYLDYLDSEWPMGPEETVLQLARLSFDASIRDLLAPLTQGAAVVLVCDEEARDARALLREIRQRRVTRLASAVPSLLHALVEVGAEPGGADSLRLILASGESLPLTLCAKIREAFGEKVRIGNQYGASEGTMTSTVYRVPSEPAKAGSASAGRPIPGTRCQVLGAGLLRVPFNVPGQVFVGGSGLTRGYSGRPDLTAAAFLPDPFAAAPGERMYATGDLGRFRPDGNLELLGRLDHQVKVRGIRLELEEVESALGRHPRIERAVAATRDDRLVAYVVRRGEPALAPDELRAFLSELLPEHAIPSFYLFLESLPLNPNGKVDRGALPQPGKPGKSGGGRSIAPRDWHELQLVRIWEEVLGVPVGVRDDLFELGGHSLLAVRLLDQIDRRLGRQLPLRALFQARTVEGLASLLWREGEIPAPLCLVPLRTGGAELPPIFWVHPISGTAFCYAELAASLNPEQTFFAFHAPGLSDNGPPLESVEALAERYLAELTAVKPEGPYRLGGWSMGGVVAFEMARRLQEAGKHVAELVLVDSRAPNPSAEAEEDLALWGDFALDLGVPAESLDACAEKALAMDTEARFGLVLELVSAEGLLPADTGRHELEALFRVFVAHRRALRRYRPQPFPGSVLFFRAVTGEPDRAAGWTKLVQGGLEVVALPGDHLSIVRGVCARLLAEQLTRRGPFTRT